MSKYKVGDMDKELKDIVNYIQQQLLYFNEIAADYHSVDYNKGYNDALEGIKDLIIGCYLAKGAQ